VTYAQVAHIVADENIPRDGKIIKSFRLPMDVFCEKRVPISSFLEPTMEWSGETDTGEKLVLLPYGNVRSNVFGPYMPDLQNVHTHYGSMLRFEKPKTGTKIAKLKAKVVMRCITAMEHLDISQAQTNTGYRLGNVKLIVQSWDSKPGVSRGFSVRCENDLPYFFDVAQFSIVGKDGSVSRPHSVTCDISELRQSWTYRFGSFEEVKAIRASVIRDVSARQFEFEFENLPLPRSE
jgi:hypothetical protein